jgi:HlyD family secretion protein
MARERIGLLLPGAASAADVRLLNVVRQREPEVASVLTATGKIVSDHKVQVTTKVSGQIVALCFEQGDRVKKGQVLARVEDVIYRARRDEAAARLEKSKAHLAFQKIAFARTERLYKEASAPEIEFADARRALQEAEAQVAADEAALQYAQKALTDCEVVAPIDGVILERNVEVGDFVAAEGGLGANANAQFGTIADMNAVRVEVDVSELDINRIHRGMPCTVAPDAYKDRRYRGRVMWLDPGANYSKATVQVKVRIENPDDYLRYEGSAQVIFLPERAASRPAGTQGAAGIWIPTTACVRDSAGNTAKVYVVSDGRLRETSVTLGKQTGNQIEVLNGLAEGQTIAAEGLDKLRDGQRIRS